jgi:hypothetical protein
MTSSADRCLNCWQTRKVARESGAVCVAGRRHRWTMKGGLIPLTVIAGRVRRWASPGEVIYFREKARRFAGWVRQYWNNSIENTLIDFALWRQDNPFDGDARAYLERGEKRSRPTPVSIYSSQETS